VGPQNAKLVSPYGGLDMGLLLLQRAEQYADRTFLTWAPFDGERDSWTYRAFAERVASLAAGLKARGIGQGDRVLLHMDNSPEFLLSWHAIARAGGVAVATNARASGEELSYFAEHSHVIGAITQPDLAKLVSENCLSLTWQVVTDHNAGAPPNDGDRPATDDRFDTLYGDASKAPVPLGDGTQPVAIHYTSGSTARPKGVVWTHNNVLWGANVSADHERLNETDKHLVTLPLFHVISGVYSAMACLWAGAEIVLQPRFSASNFWPAALEYQCTWASLVPFCTKALMREPVPESHTFRNWGHAILNSKVEEHFNVPLLGWWGMTEVITHGIVGDPRLPKRDGAIGRPAHEYELILLREDGSACEPGETGELRIKGIRGLSIFQEYLDNPTATVESFDENGYFITGDLMTLHEDGQLSFTDRAKDMLKVGGENVASAEVERVILQVDGVREVAVVGKEDPMRGQVPVAYVVAPDVGKDEMTAAILDRCSRALADFKVPKDVRLIDGMPRTGGGAKISKPELRRWIESEVK